MMIMATLLTALPIAAGADYTMKITASWLNLRTGPGMEYPVVRSYKKDKLVTVLTDVNNKFWYHVRTADGTTGYMYKSYLKEYSTQINAKVAMSGTAVAKRNVNLRVGPGTKYSAITLLPAGSKMTVIGRTGRWYQVKIGKQTGFVSGNLIRIK